MSIIPTIYYSDIFLENVAGRSDDLLNEDAVIIGQPDAIRERMIRPFGKLNSIIQFEKRLKGYKSL
jgi:hypothetical protein